MTDLPLTALATLLALGLYFYMSFQVGQARGKYGVPAPATTGDPTFERHLRVQMNTLEGMALFLPSLWMFAGFINDAIAAALALVWVIGRVIFMLSYIKDPKSRTMGFIIQFFVVVILFAGSAIAIVRVVLT
jgi:glutathione S-transferase